jgi:hypothetical protein
MHMAWRLEHEGHRGTRAEINESNVGKSSSQEVKHGGVLYPQPDNFSLRHRVTRQGSKMKRRRLPE